MAKASIVLSTADDEVRVWHNAGEKKVRLAFGDITIFIVPEDAHEIGANLIAVAATTSTANEGVAA